MSTPAPPIWRETGAGLELAALLIDPVWRGAGVAVGGGRSVLLVPGFLASDRSLLLMAHWLRRRGYRPWTGGMRANRDCADRTVARLADRLEARVAATGERVAIIGQSRGGVFARALGARRPDLVSAIVTLGSPTQSMLAVHPLVLAQIGLVSALGTAHLPGMFRVSCLRGKCCEHFRSAMNGPFPDEVGYISLYSRSDGIVDWRSCLDSEADECVEVSASHCGMGVNAQAFLAVANALARFERDDPLLARDIAEAA